MAARASPLRAALHPDVLNEVERWFAELRRRCLEGGVFCSLDELKTSIEG
ncbi:hypothetical protein [Streptomyces silvisoli]|uniref:Integrase n=1 Tax=Streptomyces silvisoli TaxID=3034235 RepID=A0ABT5ZPM0_9ACTN|nr:hypothetical protein [Streptomyces silvisoli]MDF3291779.1 hypothetical protein [Streptomyces silvisoli]